MAHRHATADPALMDIHRMVRQMTPTQHDVLKLLQQNNGICHFERIKQHVYGRREPQTSIKGLRTRGLVTLTHTVGDWGCTEIKYVRLTPRGHEALGVVSDG